MNQEIWDYIVLGGGLAGLTVATALDSSSVLVLERESEVGGLCRSVVRDGFTFDCTGHLLHFKNPDNRAWVFDLLGSENLLEYRRRAWIYVYDRYVKYPFQVHLHGLPPEVVYECLHGFIELLLEQPNRTPTDRFGDWIEQTFGRGIARHFMVPYNRKFWRHDLDELTTDWVSWSIPRPTLEDILRGALGIAGDTYGYNPVFWYPRQGGIQVLPRALARYCPHIRCGAEVRRIVWQERYVETDDGRRYPYRNLISTLPLDRLVAMLDPVDRAVAAAARRLKALTVVNYNLGIRGEPPVDAHWIYFPEDRFIFYRVGFASRFAPGMAPRGTYSLYVETTFDETREKVDLDSLRTAMLDGLEACGLLPARDDIVVEFPLCLSPAYVVFNRDRREALPQIFAYLEERDIYVTGRFGLWEYFSMDDTMTAARRLVQRLRSRTG